MIFEVPGAHFGYQNGVRNGVQNGISMLKALEGLLTGILEAMIALLEPSWALLDAQRGASNSSVSTALQQPCNNSLRRGGGEDKPLPGNWDVRV